MCDCKIVHTLACQEAQDSAVNVAYERRPVTSEFTIDQAGNPKGGYSQGEGFTINWQNGIQERRGAFLEEVIEACIQRFDFFQNSKFACEENDSARRCLQMAIDHMQRRLNNRRIRGVEGTYQP